MHGNVWEWCSDCYGEYEMKEETVDPSGPPSGSGRVLRGGCWFHDAQSCRSANRLIAQPCKRVNDAGFRLVLPPQG